jgi:hypothetical protein
VQCDPKKLSYQRRHGTRGVVYLAVSTAAGLVKVGSSTNVDQRERQMNFERYGGAGDWQVVFKVSVQEAGRLEMDTHGHLDIYRRKGRYVKDGTSQQARECFQCRPLIALNALVDAILAGKHTAREQWTSREFIWA